MDCGDGDAEHIVIGHVHRLPSLLTFSAILTDSCPSLPVKVCERTKDLSNIARRGGLDTRDNLLQDAEQAPPSGVHLVQTFAGLDGKFKRILGSMGLGVHDCEDVLQDTLVKVLRHTGEFQDARHAERWLMRLVINRCLDEHRKRRRFRQVATTVLRLRKATARSRRPDDDLILAEELDIVRQGLASLDGSLAMPLTLKYCCGMSSAEIGDLLDLPASTVRGSLSKARMVLAERLMKRGLEP